MADVDGYIKQYVDIVDRVLGVIPYERTKVWKEFFFNPTEVVSKNIDSVGERIKDIYVMTAVGVIISIVSSLPALALAGATEATNPLLALGIGMLVAVYIGGFILAPLFYLFWAFIEYIVAKLLGGTADFTGHFNASVLPAFATFVVGLPILLILVPFEWLEALPVAAICAGIIAIPFSIALVLIDFYGIYLKYKAFREVHKISMWRAIGVIFLPILVFIAFVLVLVMLFYALISAALLGVVSGGLLS